MDRVCCGAVKIFMGNKSSPFCTFLQDRICEAQRSNESPSGAFKRQSGLAQARWRGVAPTSSVGFAIKGIMDCRARQDGFAKFIVVKRR